MSQVHSIARQSSDRQTRWRQTIGTVHSIPRY